MTRCNSPAQARSDLIFIGNPPGQTHKASLTPAKHSANAFDLDGDGDIDAADLAILLGSWGDCENCPADFNGDGAVNAAGLSQLLGSWGLC